MRKNILLAIGIVVMLCLIAALFAFIYTAKHPHEHIVLRLPGMFFPSTVYLAKNDTIRFINLTTQLSWPAAGPHPTHTSYSAFDPKQGLQPLHSWTFTFAKEGAFTFHDHLAPEIDGIVISGPNDISKITSESACTQMQDKQAQAGCMEIYYRNITNAKTFPEAQAIFKDISVRFPGSCHTFAHDLGKNAYLTYLKGTMPDIGEEASSCGYGFWHGFTTAMEEDKGINASKEFCASLAGSSNELLQANRMNCYHGIGIGLIPDPPDPNEWGQFLPLVEPAVKFCDEIQGDPDYRDRCLTGVFHAMTIYMVTKEYGFSFDDNSMSNCASVEKPYQETCFNTLVAGLPDQTKFDLGKTVAILQKDVPAALFNDVFQNAAIIFVTAQAPIEDTGKFVEQCGVMDANYRTLCINAAVNKLYNNGTPGEQYIKTSAFCGGSWLHEDERAACYNQNVGYAGYYYPREKLTAVCATIPEQYRNNISACSQTQ